MKKSNKILLIISDIITVAISGAMNLFIMPAIEATTQGIRCFDMNSFGYTPETARQFLALLTEQGRNTYLHIQLPLDFVYPVAYTVFFILLFTALSKHGKKLAALPVLLMLSDYTENILSVKMLTASTVSDSLAHAASAVTVTKSMLMYACFAVIIVLLVLFAVRKRKKTKAASVTQA